MLLCSLICWLAYLSHTRHLYSGHAHESNRISKCLNDVLNPSHHLMTHTGSSCTLVFISKLREKRPRIESARQRKEIECGSLTSGGQSRALRSSRCRCWDPPPCCLVFWEQTGPLNSASCLLVQVPPAQMMARSHPQSRLLAIKRCKMQLFSTRFTEQ